MKGRDPSTSSLTLRYLGVGVEDAPSLAEAAILISGELPKMIFRKLACRVASSSEDRPCTAPANRRGEQQQSKGEVSAHQPTSRNRPLTRSDGGLSPNQPRSRHFLGRPSPSFSQSLRV